MAFDTTYDPVKPEEAIAHFKKQLELTEEEIDELGEISERRGFFVSGVADLDLLTDVWDALDKALADGTGFDQFVDDIGERLETEWGGTVANPGWRQETIYRTNLQKSYNAGRYKQATDPDVIEDRPYWLFDATLDERTTEICEKCNGTIRPADDEWWSTHQPPLHFNAIACDTLVTTKNGKKPIADIHPGELVLTHAGRFRRVYATMHKLSQKTVRTLHLSSGRALRITHEHPVLIQATSNQLIWKRAGDIQVGDHLLQHGDEVPWMSDVDVCDPHDAPSAINEPGVTREVVSLPLAAPVVLPVDLNSDHVVRECHVEHIPADGMLGDGAREDGERCLLRWGEFLAIDTGHAQWDSPLGLVDGSELLILVWATRSLTATP